MKTDNTMTAEQQWINEFSKELPEGSVAYALNAIESYKSALRKAIELKIETLKTIQARTKDYQSVFDGPIAAYEGVLETMNNVTPE